MSFDAGSIESTAELDTEPFQLALVRMDTEARKFASKKVTATVEADTANAERKVEDLSVHLRKVGDTDARASVSVDGADHANAQLDDMLGKLALVNRASATASGSSGGRGGGNSSVLGALGSHVPSGIALAAGLGAPTIAPLLGLTAGLGASLLTPFTAAGVGVGAFAVAAHSSITKVQADIKTLTADQAKYNAATSNKTRAAAQAAELKFWNSLSKPQQTAVNNLHKLSGDWSSFQKQLQPESFKLISGGIGLLSTGLHDLEPVAKATGGALDSIEKSAGKAFNDPFWKSFFTQFLPGQATKATHSFATAIGNLVTGGAHLVEDFAPLGGSFETDLDKLTKRFEDWSEGKGPSQFVAWVHKNGPVIAHDVGQIAGGVIKLAGALEPIGVTVLKDVGAVAGALGKFSKDDPHLFRDLAGALLAVGVSLKVIAGAEKSIAVLTAISKLAGAGGIGGIASAGAGGAGLGGAAEGGLLGKLFGGLKAGGVGAAGELGLGSILGLSGVSTQSDIHTGVVPGGGSSSAAVKIAQGLLAGGHSVSASASDATKIFPAQAKAIAAWAAQVKLGTLSQQALNKQIGVGIPLSATTITNADKLARSLIAQGEPLDEVKDKVQAYVSSLGTVPKTVHTTIKAETAQADAALSKLLHERAELSSTQVISESVGGGLRLTRAGGATTGTTTKKHHGSGNSSNVLRSNTGVHVIGPLARGSHPPGWLTSQGSTSPNAPTSSGSSSSGGSSSRASGPSATAISNALTSITNYAGLTFTTDLEGTAKQVRTGITTMIDRLNKAVTDHYLASDKTLVKALRAASPALQFLARQEAGVAKALSAAQGRLSTLQGEASGTRSSTLSAYQGLGDLSQAPNVTSVSGLLSVLGKQDTLAKAFTRNLATLRKKGLSKEEYDELLQAGPAAAGNVVALLAQASSSQIKALNKDTNLLTDLGISTGKASASYIYGARISGAKAQVKALSALQHELVTEQRDLVKVLAKAFKGGALNSHDARTHQLLTQVVQLLQKDNLGPNSRLQQRVRGR